MDSVHRAMCAQSLQTCSTLFDPMNADCQSALSLGFSRQKYWSGLPCPPPGYLLPFPPTQGIKPCISCVAGGFLTTELREKPIHRAMSIIKNHESILCPLCFFLIRHYSKNYFLKLYGRINWSWKWENVWNLLEIRGILILTRNL